MEKFEINENGCLTAYHNNNNKDVTQITVPDGVKHINHYIFDKYEKINIVTLPNSLESIAYSAFWNGFDETNVTSMTYRGVTFRATIGSFRTNEVIDMIANKNYSKEILKDSLYF